MCINYLYSQQCAYEAEMAQGVSELAKLHRELEITHSDLSKLTMKNQELELEVQDYHDGHQGMSRLNCGCVCVYVLNRLY